MNSEARRLLRFLVFEVDLAAGELFKQGRKVKLQGQPFDLLVALMERPGEVVTREELRERIWPSDTTVDFDQGLNRAVNKIRDALGDSAQSPQFLETLQRRGYRFIGSLRADNSLPAVPVEPPVEVPPMSQGNSPGRAKQGPGRRTWLTLLAAAVLAFFSARYFYLHRAPKLTDKDTIVLADFINTTGDPVFDGTLRQGLAVQLEQSPFLSLVSDAQIQKTLRLMAQPADARLTADLAREVCERTGSAAILEGSVASLGSQYVLWLRAKNCSTGTVLDEEQVQAARKKMS